MVLSHFQWKESRKIVCAIIFNGLCGDLLNLWEAIAPLESCVCRVVPSGVVIWKQKSGVSMSRGRWGSVRKQGKHSWQRELKIQRLPGRKKGQRTWNVSSGEWHEMRFRSRQRSFMLGLLYRKPPREVNWPQGTCQGLQRQISWYSTLTKSWLTDTILIEDCLRL